MSEPVTREEQLLSAIAAGGDILSPITRKEMYLAYLAGDTSISLPEPVTRKEQFLYQACLTGGSGGEGITPAGTKSITENGIYDVTRYASADVNVHTEEINNQDKTITANGEYTADTGYTGLGKVVVDVPTSGGGSDSDTALIGLIERTATELTIPEGCTNIGDYAFYMSAALKSVNFPDGLTSIGNYAFCDCTSLALTSLPEGLTSIGSYAFQNCARLALTSLPKGLTSIGTYAFRYCTNLALTSLPDGVTSIDSSAFSSCTNLALTSLPDGVTSIGNYAFYSCTKLTELTFEGKPSSISSSAFTGCTNLLTINVPWAEGEVANAPWGAAKATINYNYVEEG